MIVLAVIFLILLLVLLLPIKVKITFCEKLDFTVKILSFTIFDLKKRPVNTDTKVNSDKDITQDSNKDSTNILKVLKTYFDVILEILKILYK